MVIIFTVAANTGLAAVSALFVATVHSVDGCARLRLDSITSRPATASWLRPIEAALNQARLPLSRLQHDLVVASRCWILVLRF